MKKINTEIEGLGIAGALLNNESKKDKEKGFKIYYIDIDDIRPNERNKDISMPDIKELAENIALVGLEQNLVVSPKIEGKYNLLTGHRRLEALKLLVSEGKEEFRRVPCVIYDPKTFQYNLSDENKEALLWVSSNIMTRKPTSQDLLKFTETLNAVYDDLKKNNPGLVLGSKKEYIANELKISPSQVQILNSINAHLIEPAFNAFIEGKISLIVARDLAKLSNKDQEFFLSRYKNFEDISGIDIVHFLNKQKELKEQKKVELEPYTSESLEKLSDAFAEVARASEKAQLSNADALKAQKLVNLAYSNIDKLYQMLSKNQSKD